jgi:two-component system, LytTR family, sensor kinase
VRVFFYFHINMDRLLLRRLVFTALFSSPIIALYGVTPVYIFVKVPVMFVLFAGSGILLNVLIFWLINITIIKFSGGERRLKWYALSYCCILLFHVIFIAIRDFLPTPPQVLRDGEFLLRTNLLLAYPLLSVVAINTIILIISNSILTSQRNKNAAFEIEQLKVANLESQKLALMQQLQPHFLFNTLSVLKSLIKESPEEAENYAIKLAEFLRYSIQVHKRDVVTLEQELDFTKDYIDLQKVRFSDSLIVSLDVPTEAFAQNIPAFGLQTLVENAIKHNSFTERKPLYINIGYNENTITVWNNKTFAHSKEANGTGLANLNQRYKIIANKEISVIENNDSFSVSVGLLNPR